MFRERYIQNGQMFVRFTRWPSLASIAQLLRKKPHRPMWRAHDLHGNALDAPPGITVCSPNNWLRRLLYAVGAPRRLTRKV